MEADFWHERWNSSRIGFHQKDFNPLLAEYFDRLGLETGARVFVPLSGKSNDIGWLLSKGFNVVGVELSEHAITQLFANLGIYPQITKHGELKLYEGANITIFAGDIFHMTREVLGAVDMIYDRAALVALPDDMRTSYASHLVELSHTAPQFIIAFEYDQTKMDGPPFSTPHSEVERLYGQHYTLTQIAKIDVEAGLKGVIPATEHVWWLH